jgi:hypothetical protein
MVFMARLSLGGEIIRRRAVAGSHQPVPINRNLLFDFKNASDHTPVSPFTILRGSAVGFSTRSHRAASSEACPIERADNPSFSIYANASFSNYVTQVFKPIDGVAFIGHSVTDPAGSYAVGVCFGANGIFSRRRLVLTPLSIYG